MRRLLSAVAVGLLVALAPLAHAEDPYEVKIEFKDGKANPLNLTVPAGKKIRIVVTNAGTQPVEFESTDLRKEKVLGPGVTSSVICAPMQPGTYKWFDDFHPNTAKGTIVAR
ncbi:cupredoxin domain-containing protein [Amantichitinum ursilacus]|uniref:Inactive ferrous ion transporter periplasmic protein EfeO n=1 Tax=Amantichitinum ursilacus TaxID=857265 RepID=A0A0N1JTK1_9NEIS|nr:cupredoxin domain-containing protein [Amantichitinum ursilacus]KPC54606.1 inactive ferrous ion transporter periplasmic protein EfeO [Amantichitinum ursilacus]